MYRVGHLSVGLRRLTAWFRASIGLMVWACAPHSKQAGGPGAEDATRVVESPPGAEQTTLLDVGWRTVLLRTQALTLALPEATSWRTLTGDTWWTAEHAASNSRLRLKAWRESQLADTQDCERQARLWRSDLLRPAQEEIVSQRTQVLADYQADVVVFSRSLSADAALQQVLGAVLVFGADVRNCLALEFRTEASGALASRVIADRLALISEQVLPKIRRQTIDDRVERRQRGD